MPTCCSYGYWDNIYGLQNEVQLSVAESTCGAKTAGWAAGAGDYGHCLFGVDELSRVALERCDTAKCAVQTMGDLATEYGGFGASTHRLWSATLPFGSIHPGSPGAVSGREDSSLENNHPLDRLHFRLYSSGYYFSTPTHLAQSGVRRAPGGRGVPCSPTCR